MKLRKDEEQLIQSTRPRIMLVYDMDVWACTISTTKLSICIEERHKDVSGAFNTALQAFYRAVVAHIERLEK